MLNRPNVVLVRPKFPRNIGSCARAMANMGAGELILIDCNCELGLEARQGAAGAQKHLFEARKFSSLLEMSQSMPHGLKIGFSGKAQQKKDSLSFTERKSWLKENRSDSLKNPIYLFFGPEDDGLNSAEMSEMNYVHELPTAGDFKSMNLSHAVLLALFMFNTDSNINNLEKVDSSVLNLNLEAALSEWLTTLGFDLDQRKRSALTVLKKSILENAPTAEDLKVLSAIIHQTIRKLKS